MKKTYLYVTPFFPSPSQWRGAYSLDFIRALRSYSPDLRVEVFVPGDGIDYEIEGIKVWRFKERVLPSSLLPMFFRKSNEQSFMATLNRAGVNIDDVIICHGNTARFAVYPLAIKRLNLHCLTLLHHHDLASFGLNNGILHKSLIYNSVMFPLLRRLHEQIDCHVFISEASRKSFLSAPNASWTVYRDYKAQMRGPKLFGCRTARISKSLVLHNGVDATIFKLSTQHEPRKGFVIGCVANFEVLKDQMTLMRAISILKRRGILGVRALFVGSGRTMAGCKSFAKENGIDAEFYEEVRHEDLPRFYHGLDLFVLPSYFEGFGCVYTEAWSCGVPFIGCEGQGIEDVIPCEDRNKWLCRPKDAIDLADKIEAYIENRWQQRLSESVDINTLVGNFCKAIGV